MIEMFADCGHADTLRGIAEQYELLDCWIDRSEEEERCCMRLLVRKEKQQVVLDALQGALSGSEHWRINLLPVETTLPRPEAPDESEQQEKKYSGGRSREELYQAVQEGTRLDTNFILLTVFSTIVAAIGLLADNVAVVIGAMVIAPLLGPNIALAFGTALGDKDLIWQALKTNFAGVSLALVLSFAIGLLWTGGFASAELQARTDVGLDGVILALIAGAAGVLSLASGLSSALVGVMVAVALLPPAAAMGLMLAGGDYSLALGAGLLLAVNVVCVNLAAKLVFVFKGVKPRGWLEARAARQSITAYIIFWIVSLLILLAVMQVRHTYLAQ
jgi:uncharacterized hydrophobic protein (TIGR00341 family)